MTVQRILNDISRVYNYYLKDDQRVKYAPLIYKALLAKLKKTESKSLRNIIANSLF